MVDQTTEEWVSIPGYEGFYEISNLGRVKSLERSEAINGGTRIRKERILTIDGGRARLLRGDVYKSISIQSLLGSLFPETIAAQRNEEGEEWLPIPGYEGVYEVSNHYRVRSLPRETTHGTHQVSRMVPAKLLSVYRNNGYLVAHLWGTKDQPQKKFYVEATVEHLFPDAKPEIEDDLSQPGEEWRPVAGYEGLYEVSNFGRVKSLGRYVSGLKRRFARPYIRIPNSYGNTEYLKVELARGLNVGTPEARSEIKTLSIHRLVAIAFIPNPNNLPIVHHRDENKMNNRADNLEWTTAEGNVQDWFDRRRIVVGVDTIEMIIAAHAAGKSPAEILAALPRRTKKRHGA